jgi:hypothetical protein
MLAQGAHRCRVGGGERVASDIDQGNCRKHRIGHEIYDLQQTRDGVISRVARIRQRPGAVLVKSARCIVRCF